MPCTGSLCRERLHKALRRCWPRNGPVRRAARGVSEQSAEGRPWAGVAVTVDPLIGMAGSGVVVWCESKPPLDFRKSQGKSAPEHRRSQSGTLGGRNGLRRAHARGVICLKRLSQRSITRCLKAKPLETKETL